MNAVKILALLNAAEWLAVEVSGHAERCTCGSCHAVANCADIITATRAKKIAELVRQRLSNENRNKMGGAAAEAEH